MSCCHADTDCLSNQRSKGSFQHGGRLGTRPLDLDQDLDQRPHRQNQDLDLDQDQDQWPQWEAVRGRGCTTEPH